MSIRTERVAEMVQREVARILQREYSDQLQPMVTITHARVTGDLSIAYVYASVMGDTSEKRKATFQQLKQLTPQIRDHLASRIRHEVKTIPELKFFLDESLQKAKRMETLFDRIQEERQRREHDGNGTPASDDAETRAEADADAAPPPATEAVSEPTQLPSADASPEPAGSESTADASPDETPSDEGDPSPDAKA